MIPLGRVCSLAHVQSGSNNPTLNHFSFYKLENTTLGLWASRFNLLYTSHIIDGRYPISGKPLIVAMLLVCRTDYKSAWVWDLSQTFCRCHHMHSNPSGAISCGFVNKLPHYNIRPMLIFLDLLIINATTLCVGFRYIQLELSSVPGPRDIPRNAFPQAVSSGRACDVDSLKLIISQTSTMDN
jgi:hypothetical protein